jgi:metal-responsive CopG/Arc/MetJ family transcriptional regulator
MNNKIPEEEKKVKLSISIDPELNKKIEEVIKNKFYKKSRFIEFLIRKYIDDFK